MPASHATPTRGSWRLHLVCLAVLAVQGTVAALRWQSTEELREHARSGDAERMTQALPILAMRGDPETITAASLTRMYRSAHPRVRELAYCDELTRYVPNRQPKKFLAAIEDEGERLRCMFWMKKLGTHKINLNLYGLRLYLDAMKEVEDQEPW